MIGETISHYRITEKLGAGGMGVVYKARDLQLERFVALKFLPPDLALSETERERFLREARSASALDHPNIGVIHGIEKTPDGQLFIVMAYYEGQTLAQKMSARPLPLRQAMDWVVQIASGLAAAHVQKIVHRDIKPSNILITAENVARIVDFGLARVVATPSATMTGGTTGTLPYMSPEQILSEQVDQRCDVWALSILLVQMITGRHPFARDTSTAMTFAILNQPPAAIDTLPAVLQPIALHGLAKDPRHRYTDAKEMLADLEACRTQLMAAGASAEEPTLTQSIASEALKEIATHASTPRWQTGGETRTKQFRFARYVIVALAVAALGASSLLLAPVRERAAALLSGSGGQKHVAVLPFDNIGNDPANEAVAQGLMDSFTSELSNLDAGKQSLWVVPSSVVRSRKISDPSAAGKELGANLVVKGSIRRDGRDVQLTVNLIDANSLRQIGSESLHDRTGDLASLQNQAVARMARLMNINVTAEMLRATGGRASPAAYELYLKALGLMQRYDKPGNLDQAVAVLEDAIKTDPEFALGYASLGEAYRLKNQVDPNPRWIEQASVTLERAIQIDNRLPAPYVSLGRLHSSLAKHDLALQEFQRALTINPRDAEALKGIAGAYERMSRTKDAEESYKRAIALKPDYWDGYNSLGFFYYRQNRFPDAIVQFQRVVELTPDNAAAHSNLAAAYLGTGEKNLLASARTELEKSIQLSPSYAAYANLGNVYMDERQYAKAVEVIRKALEINDKDFRIWNNLLNAHLWLGDADSASKARLKTTALAEAYIRDHPQDAEVHSLLSNFYAAVKQQPRAQREIDLALTLQPKNPGVLADVAESYDALGNRALAIRYAKSSLANGGTLADLQSRPGLQSVLEDPNFRASGNRPN